MGYLNIIFVSPTFYLLMSIPVNLQVYYSTLVPKKRSLRRLVTIQFGDSFVDGATVVLAPE